MPRRDAKSIQAQTETIMARVQLRAAKEVDRQQRAALKEMNASLSTYRAARVDRRNRDWTQANASADLAIIPDSVTLIARSRQMARDFPLASSAVRAFKRNTVGNGIGVTPHAKDKDGKPLEEFNRVAKQEYTRWSESKSCHVENVMTFRQQQRLAASERFIAGEHLMMWSYQTPTRANGKLDLSRPCGLQTQGFEPEQFDLRLISYEGREVRGGVEIDENYRPVGYHLYTRNPWDVLYRFAFKSARISAERMFHYMDHERVLQARGVTPLASIMQLIRNLERFNDATLTRAMMEACIGLVIKTALPVPTGIGGSFAQSPTIVPAQGDSGQTPSGMNEGDMVPGMIGKLRPGEDVSTVVPTTPGNMFPPFVTLNTRMAGAGIGMSYGRIMRESTGNYSAARQDMLEDRKEDEPEQTLIIDDIIKPTYERFLTFAALEGRFDGVKNFEIDDFHENRWRYVEADYVPPPMPWIDPEKEANAFKILLELNLITREKIAAQRGERFLGIVLKKELERKAMIAAGLQVTEDQDDLTERREVVKSALTSRDPSVSAMTVNATDLAEMIADAQLPARDTKVAQIDLPITPAAPAPSPTVTSANPASKRMALDVVTAPNYRASREPSVVSCEACSWAVGGRCVKFDFQYNPVFVCDAWAARTLTDNVPVSGSKILPPLKQDGNPQIDLQFWPQADQSKMYPGFSMASANGHPKRIKE